MSQNPRSHPWIPDQGDGTYSNPVLHADYSDPDAVRVGDDFYLTASSFNCTPGLPILHSRDLVNWQLVNHALRGLPDERYAEVQQGQGVWAPAMRHHDGRFWIVFPTPDEGLYVTTAEDPLGEWSEPHLLMGGSGLIDPCPLWDDDGNAYLIFAYAASRCGIRNKLHIVPMSPDGREILGEGKVVIEIDPELPALEGPKFLKRNGWYYISAPGGGVPTGWQNIFRSRDIYGPYEEKIVLAQRGTSVNGPHQGALVDTPGGDWWFLHFQEKQPYGRIVHLQPVRWEDDWPMIGVDQDEDGVGRPVMTHRKPLDLPGGPLAPPGSDSFDGPELGLQWQWQANHRAKWSSLTSRPGHLRLHPVVADGSDLTLLPNALLQKFPAPGFAVATEVELPPGHAGLHAGLAVIGRQAASLDIQRSDAGYSVRLMVAGECAGEFTSYAPTVVLQVRVADGGSCRFGVVTDESPFHQIGPAFQAVPGVWIGAKVGLYCLADDAAAGGGYADFEWFRLGALGGAGERSLHLVPDHDGGAAQDPAGGQVVKLSGSRAGKGGT